MASNYDYILAKHEDNGGMPLMQHLKSVADAAVVIAQHGGLDEKLARKGAILHDIGKVSPLFQRTLKHGYIHQPGFVFRHEIASLLFLSLFPEEERPALIDMIVAHHKSISQDVSGKGILDLDGDINSFKRHADKFAEWSPIALAILEELGIKTHSIDLDEAEKNYEYVIDFCEKKPLNVSMWKGVLMAADHYASALEEKAEDSLQKLFITPNLSFYNRTHHLYPLSFVDANDIRKHTLVTAPTGAGKLLASPLQRAGVLYATLPSFHQCDV